MNAVSDSHREAFERHLQSSSLRRTRQRDAILDVFLGSDEHFTSEELHERVAADDPSISLSTVYRTLKLFVEAGIASERHFRDGVTRFEVRHTHHDHLICVRCGRIAEFENDEIERLQERIAEDRGYRLVSHRHELYGHCAACRRKARKGGG